MRAAIVEVREDLRQSGAAKDSSALAFDMHAFYMGCERILKTCIKPYNPLPAADDWHKQLLALAAKEDEGRRPSVISPETAQILEPFLKFRHFVRNAYPWTLDKTKLLALADEIEPAWIAARTEVVAFSDFISKQAQPTKPPTGNIKALKLPQIDSPGDGPKRDGMRD